MKRRALIALLFFPLAVWAGGQKVVELDITGLT